MKAKINKEKLELYEYILKYYVTGVYSRKEIAEIFNISELTLRSFLYYHGLSISPDKRRKETK